MLPNRNNIKILFFLPLFLILTACGGGGSDDSSNASATPTGTTQTPTETTPTETSPAETTPESSVETTKLNFQDLFVTPISTGTVAVQLHPQSTIALSQSQRVTFGVPFPKGFLTDSNNLVVKNVSGDEIPASVTETVYWRDLETNTIISIRNVQVEIEYTFSDYSVQEIIVEFGAGTRTANLTPLSDHTSNWVTISNGINPAEYPSGEQIKEPTVYATLPPDWLSACLLRTRTTALGTNSGLSWFDTAYANFSKTAVNDVDERVTDGNKIDYVSQAAPWLFDRAMTLFGTYIQTGDVKWLRHAHRAAQFYANHISASGYFDLKSYEDLKYSYGQSMLLDYMLFGDARLLPKIEAVASAGEGWNPVYTTASNFWTERHQTYALLAALSAWELTGGDNHAARVKEIADASFNHALNPPNGWPVIGCMPHELHDHEGDATNEAVCSPWMNALFADAIWRYYIHSQDDNALIFLGNLADYMVDYGTYVVPEGHSEVHMVGKALPYYLASHEYTYSGPWSDFEHTCDVAGAMAKGLWAKERLGQDSSSVNARFTHLMQICQENLDYWYRPSAPEVGYTAWRLNPPRKYSWWFGTTSDLAWFLN